MDHGQRIMENGERIGACGEREKHREIECLGSRIQFSMGMQALNADGCAGER